MSKDPNEVSKLQLKHEIKKLKFSQPAEDVAKKVISKSFVVSLALVIGATIYSAMYLSGESLAVVASIIAPIGIGLIQLMTSVSGSDKEDPIVSVVKKLVDQSRDAKESLNVDVVDGKVHISHGEKNINVEESP